MKKSFLNRIYRAIKIDPEWNNQEARKKLLSFISSHNLNSDEAKIARRQLSSILFNKCIMKTEIEIPKFPLEGVILFPGSILPLNIFEKRYLNMIDDCLKKNIRLIGIIQPLTRIKKDLNSYQNIVGCYGKIIRFEETDKK